MLWYANSFRNRFYLRVNDEEKPFRVWNPITAEWNAAASQTMGSVTAAVRFSLNGQRVDVSSHTGYRQVIFMANSQTNRTIGRLEVSDYGAITMHDGPQFATDTIPEYWQQKMLVMIGVPGASTINVHDCLGDDDDIIRLKPGHSKIFIPHRYAKETAQYDVCKPTQKKTVNDESSDFGSMYTLATLGEPSGGNQSTDEPEETAGATGGNDDEAENPNDSTVE